MSIGLVILILIFFVAAFVAVAVALDLPIFGSGTSALGSKNQIKNIVSAQRAGNRMSGQGEAGRSSVFDTAAAARVDRVKNSQLTLEKKLRYAQWKISPLMFRAAIVTISLLVMSVTSQFLNPVMTGLSLLSGPLFVNWLLNLYMDSRFKRFDADYPQFILALVGLLKTGMNAMTALEAAAHGLEESSLVREEVVLMIERLRFGVPEDKSIGSFAEDVYHPEIELFVQALLLSRRVGGNLADTLERLAQQVRKRQFFRSSANAAVGMQRGSIWIILAIMAFMEFYLYLTYPAAVVDAIKNPIGWQVWQFGIAIILLGIFWVRQVTKIRV